MKTKYLFSTNPSFLLQRLIEQYEKQDKLIVAYDFDDTVKPYWCADCGKVQSILRRLRDNIDAYFIVYTCNKDHEEIRDFLNKWDIPYDSINENAPFAPNVDGKLFYNVFLDDKAGLGEVVNTLDQFLYLVLNGYINKSKKNKCSDAKFHIKITGNKLFLVDNYDRNNILEIPDKISKEYIKNHTVRKKEDAVDNALFKVADFVDKIFDTFDRLAGIKPKNVEVEQVISRWYNPDGKSLYKCMECGRLSSKNYMKCPSCDSYMANGDISWDRRK